jgi:peptidoglycan lytic transglycosylase G
MSGDAPEGPPRRGEPGRRGRGRPLLVAALIAAVGAAAIWLIDHERSAPAPAPPTTTAEPPPISVTFPEGLRREDMARILSERTRLSADAYLAATGPSRRGARLAGSGRPTSLEGFLFPATYLVGSRTTVDDLVTAQLDAYRARVAGVDYRYARSRNLTPYDVLIIASMVEREVQVPGERAVVAGVIYNRLRRRMRLDIDATVRYAIGSWTAPLTRSDLEIDSPYNTRRYSGLPPAPISSPGLASIRAAAHPRITQYVYFVARADGSGRHYFATTIDQFNRAVARADRNAAAG